MVKIIQTGTTPAAIGPYSQGVEAGEFVFISGQTPLDPKSMTMVNGGVKEQTRQVLANVTALLKAAGLTTANVVKTTGFLADMDDFATMNELYGDVFSEPRPARSTIQAARLPMGALVEIECVARKPYRNPVSAS